MTPSLPFFSYGSAAAAFAALTIALLSVWRQRETDGLLSFASLATMAWAAVLSVADGPVLLTPSQLFALETGVAGVWLYYFASILRGALTSRRAQLLRFGGVILAVMLLLVASYTEWIAEHAPGRMDRPFLIGLLALSLYGIVLVEQVYRNARRSQKEGLRYLALGAGLLFVYNLLLFSGGIASGQVSELFWDSRGFIACLSALLIGVSVSQSSAWAPGLFLSRKVVFYTTTLIGSAVYLVVVAVAGYYLEQVDPAWGPAAQLVFLTVAIVVLLIVFSSHQARAKIRVMIAKNFFENKYDYRDEWLRLMDTMTGALGDLPLEKRAIKALADILDAQSGVLWYRNKERSGYVAAAGWGRRHGEQTIVNDDPLVRFLGKTGWIIDLRELHEDPSSYAGLVRDRLDALFGFAAFIIPLIDEDEILGFVALGRPGRPVSLNFEDHDLLKTAGRQIARDLATAEASERLSETMQFEAFNKLTAYIMHDLNNAIAQQSLVVENAAKHKRNPAFVDDAIETISRSVVRMRRVMTHLQQGTVELTPKLVSVHDMLRKAVDASRDRQPVPRLAAGDADARVQIDADRFFMAVCHAIRNAQDATPGDGHIEITARLGNGTCSISITDDGEGMDPDFVRNRLFRPFDSTKGVEGMGIGAYQIRETLRAAGGDVEVQSARGEGTTLTLIIPVADR
jgi:putative PEP-CTERM system histidine kinase